MMNVFPVVWPPGAHVSHANLGLDKKCAEDTGIFNLYVGSSLITHSRGGAYELLKHRQGVQRDKQN